MGRQKTPPRRLFLDDDPARASAFLEKHPDAVWVQTVPECLEKLAESWDEVHLDHDLGGEQFVDPAREDCGMEVVRWIARQPRKTFRRTQFLVHSHNIAAAFTMAMTLQSLGYQVDARPFGVEPPPEPPRSGWLATWLDTLRGVVGRFRRPPHESEEVDGKIS